MKSKSGVPSALAGRGISERSISSLVHLLLNAYFTLSFLMTVAMKMAIAGVSVNRGVSTFTSSVAQ